MRFLIDRPHNSFMGQELSLKCWEFAIGTVVYAERRGGARPASLRRIYGEDAILQPVSTPRQCRVSFQDPEGIEHAVTVTAESLYEAVGLGLHAFRNRRLIDYEMALMSIFAVSAAEPVVTHRVTLQKFQNWLGANGKSPKEQVLKSRLRGLLGLTSA